MKDDNKRITGIIKPQETHKDILSDKPMPNLGITNIQDKKALSDKPIQNISKPATEKTGKK